VNTRIEADVVMDISAPRDDVFAILADGWNYPNWVVGASHVRAVDDGWPEPGTRIHHSVGPWPLHLEDDTEVVAVERPRLLVLDARLWPIGEARIRLELEELGGHDTRIRMTERAVRGPISLAPGELQARLLAPRNRESLRRLADLAVGRSSGVGPGDSR
jgi:uncharacterized protein YndB with AHSA1/START domain